VGLFGEQRNTSFTLGVHLVEHTLGSSRAKSASRATEQSPHRHLNTEQRQNTSEGGRANDDLSLAGTAESRTSRSMASSLPRLR